MARSDDSIKFSLAAEDTVVNDTVKIVAHISAIVAHDSSEETLKKSIREMMEKFINAKWQFAGLVRSAHASGMEEVNLVAYARVPESENRALERRRDEASKAFDNMQIQRVQPDISFPASLVAETEQKLRLTIIEKAQAACKEIKAAMGRDYRISKINYNPDLEELMYSNSRMSASSASMKSSYGSGFGGADSVDPDAIGNAQKFTMVATVTLSVASSQKV